MSKYSFRPVSVDFLPNIPLGLAIVALAVSAGGALDAHHGFVDRVACCCFTALASNMWYILMTTIQCIKFQLHLLFTRARGRRRLEQNEKKRGAVIDDRQRVDNTDDIALITGQYSLQNIIFHTVEFRHAPREVRLFVSRKELWYIFYPCALAIFVLFYCVPIYDVTCTVSLVMGLMMKTCYDEVQRGVHWKRSTGRKLCFYVVMLCGLISGCGLLVLSAVMGQQSHASTDMSNSTLLATPSPNVHAGLLVSSASILNDSTHVNMLGTLLHDDERNGALRRADLNGSAMPDVHDNGNGTKKTPNVTRNSNSPKEESQSQLEDEFREAFDTAYVANVQSPDLWQRVLIWSVCFYIPFFLGSTPDAIRLPVLMEVVQPSVSCIAAFLLFAICAISQDGWTPWHLLNCPHLVAFILLAPPGVWCVIYFIMKGARSKTSTHTCCILMMASYIKLLHAMNFYPSHGGAFEQVCVFVGSFCALYVGLTLVFIRMENKCIRMGWDSGQEEDEGDEYGNELDLTNVSNGAGHSQIDNMELEDFTPRYCIEDVLHRVTEDIKNTEYILTHPSSKTRLVSATTTSASVSPTVKPLRPASGADVTSDAQQTYNVEVHNAAVSTTMLHAIEEGGTALESENDSQNAYDASELELPPTHVDQQHDPPKNSKTPVRGDKKSVYSKTPQKPLLGDS